MKKMRIILFVLALSLWLVACGGAEPTATPVPTAAPTQAVEPTEEPVVEPTAEPVEEPTEEPVEEPTEEPAEEPTEEPTAEPEPTAEGDTTEAVAEDAVVSEAGGFSFMAPEGYESEVLGEFVTLAAPDADPDLGPNFFFSGGPFEEGESVDAILESFLADVVGEEGEATEPEAITVGGLEGFTVEFSSEEEAGTLTGLVVVVGDDARGFVAFGGGPAETWETDVKPMFMALLETVELFEPVAEEETTDEDTDDDTETTMPVIDTTVSTDPGIACFATLVDGVTCLSAEGEWQSFTTENSDIASDTTGDFAVCGTTLVIANYEGLVLYDGAEFSLIPGDWGFSSPEGVACDANGGFWVGYYGGVGYYDGSAWTTYEAADLAVGDVADLIYDVTVDGAGNVWVASANSVSTFDGTEWTIFSEGEGFDDTYYFSNLATAPDGSVWALHSSGLLQWTGSEWVAFESDEYFTLEGLTIDAEGNIWIGSYSDGAIVFDGESWTAFNVAEDGIASNNVGSIAVDSSGRVWLATSWGISVWTGEEWVNYRMDTADLINHDLEMVAVVGAGPALPELMTKAPGSLTGKVLKDGAPVVDTVVEICVESLGMFYYGDSPCSDQQVYFSTTTDADGVFTFTDIPVGLYVITIQTEDSWAQLETEFGFGSELTPVYEGETTEVGELTLSDEE